MNTRFLEEFLILAEELNYSTAAERLFTARPTLVEHIRSLESELSCKLVLVRQRRVVLTAAGSRFVQTARELLKGWDAVVQEYSTLADNLLEVRVASSNLPWLETILFKARRSIHETYPYKRIEIVTDNGALATADALDKRENDIAVVGYKSYLCPDGMAPLPDGLCGFLLRTEEILLLVTQDSPLFGRDAVAVSDLDGMTFMLPPDIYASWTRDHVAGQLEQRGARVDLQTRDFTDHAEYFSYEFGRCLGIVPATLVPRMGIDEREEFHTFSLVDFTLQSSFFAVFKQSFVNSENGGILYEEMRRIAELGAR